MSITFSKEEYEKMRNRPSLSARIVELTDENHALKKELDECRKSELPCEVCASLTKERRPDGRVFCAKCLVLYTANRCATCGQPLHELSKRRSVMDESKVIEMENEIRRNPLVNRFYQNGDFSDDAVILLIKNLVEDNERLLHMMFLRHHGPPFSFLSENTKKGPAK